MLDDLKYIHEKDAQDALGLAEKQWQQLEHNFALPDINFTPDNVVYAGMGGSALAALVSSSWPSYRVPFEIVRNYTLPAYVDNKTLCIIASYSGNTEETLSCLAEAEEKKARIVVIASGGKLQELAQKNGHPFVLLPKASQPRYGVMNNLKAYVGILEKAGLVAAEQAEPDIRKASMFLSNSVKNWLPTVPTAKNTAKQIAQELMGKSVIIYSGPLLFPAAYKWKISINENAKQIAWCNQLPEFNHNEMLGWTEQPMQKPYAVVDIRSNLEHSRVEKRFTITERLLSGKRPSPIVVEPQGKDLLEQLLWAITLGDFVSLYLAILNGLNPTPVDLIEKLKNALAN